MLYYKNYYKDGWKFRGYVLLLWTLDSAHEFTLIRWGFRVLVRDPGDQSALIKFEW